MADLYYIQESSAAQACTFAQGMIKKNSVIEVQPLDVDGYPEQPASLIVAPINGSLSKTFKSQKTATFAGAEAHAETTASLQASYMATYATTSWIEAHSLMEGNVSVPATQDFLCGRTQDAAGIILFRMYKLTDPNQSPLANLCTGDFKVDLSVTDDTYPVNGVQQSLDMRFTKDLGNSNTGSFVNVEGHPEQDGKHWIVTYRVYNSSMVPVKLSQQSGETTHVAGSSNTYSYSVGNNYSRVIPTVESISQEGTLMTRVLIGKSLSPTNGESQANIWITNNHMWFEGCSGGSTTSIPYSGSRSVLNRGRITLRHIRALG